MNKLELLGFTDMDGFFLTTCLFCGALGAVLDYVLKRDDWVNLPAEEPVKMAWHRWFPLLVGRVIVGVAAGWFMWLVLSGGLIQNKENFLRLVLVSFVGGIVAPAAASRYRKQMDEYLLQLIKSKG